jgi:hypothetical protein
VCPAHLLYETPIASLSKEAKTFAIARTNASVFNTFSQSRAPESTESTSHFYRLLTLTAGEKSRRKTASVENV